MPVVTTPQPALDAAVGAALVAAYGSDADAQTGLAPAAAVVNSVTDEPGSATFRALAWSQDDDAANEPVPYTGEDPYDTNVTSARPPVAYVPATGPIDEESRPWHRLPQLIFGLAAVVALIAVGGVAIALTGVADTTNPTDPPSTATSAAPISAEPPPSAPVPPSAVTVPSQPPPPLAPPAPTTTVAPVATTQITTTTPPTTTTTTPTTHDHHDDDHYDHDYDYDDHHHDAADDDHHHNADHDDDVRDDPVRSRADTDSGAEQPVSAGPVTESR